MRSTRKLEKSYNHYNNQNIHTMSDSLNENISRTKLKCFKKKKKSNEIFL